MTRLLITTDNYPPRWDGISRFLQEIIPRLQSYHITVICPDFGDHEIRDATHVKIELSDYGIGDYDFAKPNHKAVRQAVEKADLIFGQSIGTIGSLAGHYARKTGTPIVHYTHSIEWQLAPRATEKTWLNRAVQAGTRAYAQWYYNRVNHLITPSRNISETIHYEGISTSTSVAPLGVDHDVFKPREAREGADAKPTQRIREKHSFDGHPIIGYHGRLAREKDLLTLLRAIKRLRKQRQDFTVLLVGDGLESLRTKFEADPQCTTVRAQEHVEHYVSAFDIFVTPTLTETTSLSTAEAMACGNAVVATPAGYIEDYVNHKENGLLFDKHDNFMLSKYLDGLLSDPEERERLGHNAVKTARSVFQWDNTAEHIDAVLQRCLSRS
jgi:glycosyltransferase involved in cell wall biosynthesis